MHEFESIIGNRLNINALQSHIMHNQVSHSYIIDGEHGSGKKLLGYTFAKTLLCEKNGVNPCCKCISCQSFESGNNPDFIQVKPEKTKSIGIDDIRDKITYVVEIRPFKYKYKIFIIENAETLTVQAQNALLKTIEEPPKYAIFIILTNNSTSFLPTILSRCVILKIKPLTKEQVLFFLKEKLGQDNINLDSFSAYACGNIGKALEISKSEEFFEMRESVLNILNNFSNESLTETLLNYKYFENKKENINMILDIINIWYRDIMIYKESENSDYILEKDKSYDIIQISKTMNLESLIRKIDYIQTVKEQLKRNSNFQMTIEVMMLKLKEK